MTAEFRVAETGALAEGEVHTVHLGGRDLGVYRHEEEVRALSGACPYHPLPLEGARVRDDVLTCQWYGAQFDVRTGAPILLRKVRPLAVYPAEVRDGAVFVRLPVDAAGRPVIGSEDDESEFVTEL